MTMQCLCFDTYGFFNIDFLLNRYTYINGRDMEKGSREAKNYRLRHRCCCCFLRLLPIIYSMTQDKWADAISARTVGIEISRSTLFSSILLRDLQSFLSRPSFDKSCMMQKKIMGRLALATCYSRRAKMERRGSYRLFSLQKKRKILFFRIPSPFFYENQAGTLIICCDVNTRNRLMGVTTTITTSLVSKTWA